jgi:SET domain-containing protein
MMLVKTRVGPSAIHGLGLFAVEPIPRHTPVWRFLPEFDRAFSPTGLAAWPPLARAHLRWFAFVSKTDGHLILSGDHACFMNHASPPNTGAPPGAGAPVTTVALRDIAAGEELTCDYFAFDADAPWKLGHPPADAPLGAQPGARME